MTYILRLFLTYYNCNFQFYRAAGVARHAKLVRKVRVEAAQAEVVKNPHLFDPENDVGDKLFLPGEEMLGPGGFKE